MGWSKKKNFVSVWRPYLSNSLQVSVRIIYSTLLFSAKASGLQKVGNEIQDRLKSVRPVIVSNGHFVMFGYPVGRSVGLGIATIYFYACKVLVVTL